MKNSLVSLPLLALLAVAGGAHAQSGTITFNGEVTSTTCDVSFNGVVGNDPTITLPTVSAVSLKAGNSAGHTPVVVTISGADPICNTGNVVMTLNPSRTANLVGGRLENGPTINPAGNVAIGIRDEQDRLIDLTAGWSSTPVSLAPGGAEVRLAAEYYADTYDATAGNVSAALAYTLTYH